MQQSRAKLSWEIPLLDIAFFITTFAKVSFFDTLAVVHFSQQDDRPSPQYSHAARSLGKVVSIRSQRPKVIVSLLD
jgi:hypothetical protein